MTSVFYRTRSVLLALVTTTLLAGCNSIQSAAVRDLIRREGGEISSAKDNAAAFEQETKRRNKALGEAVDSLNEAVVELRKLEAIIAVVYAANQSAENSQGADAEAIAYLATKAYLNTDGGLAKSVRDQFKADQAAMTKIASQLSESWAAIASQHAQIADYATKTGTAGVDPAALGAILAESGVTIKLAQKTLEQGQRVEKALEAVGATGLVGDSRLAGTRGYLGDLVNLLQQAGADGGS